MIIVNTPHNPVGKVFTKSELEAIAAIAEEFNLLVMADEVVCLWLFSETHSLNRCSSTTALFSMARNMFASPTYRACGIAL